MFVIKSNNSEKKSLSNRDFFISKKYNKRRILTSYRKRDREFHLKNIYFKFFVFIVIKIRWKRKKFKSIVFARFKKLSKVFTMLHVHVDDNCHLSIKNGSLPSPVLN